MRLRYRISLVAWTIRLSGLVLVLVSGTLVQAPGLSVLLALGWLVSSGPLLRHVLLPLVFRVITCPGCRRLLPLVGRFKCGDHYIDHCERHILTFVCSHAHRLEGFDCPRCRATIIVQKGDPKTYRHGSAVRLRAVARSFHDGAGLLLGHDPHGQPVLVPPEQFSWHVAITGGTGRGKSTLLLNLLRQLAGEGKGCTVLDPGGDLSRPPKLGH